MCQCQRSARGDGWPDAVGESTGEWSEDDLQFDACHISVWSAFSVSNAPYGPPNSTNSPVRAACAGSGLERPSLSSSSHASASVCPVISHPGSPTVVITG
jgi:hypothetical protein